MDKLITIFILLLEILMVLQCIQIVFGRTINFDKYVIGIIISHIVLYTLINHKIIPFVCSIILYALIYLFCYYKFKLKFIQTLIRIIVIFSLVGCIEGISAFIFYIIGNADNSKIYLLFSSILALVITNIIKWIIFLVENTKRKKWKNWHLIVIIFYSIMFVRLLIEYYFNQSVINIYVLFASTFLILIFGYLHKLEKARDEVEKRNYEIKLQNVYGKTYQTLLSEVRRKQHDYKNQLGAMLGMHLTAQSLEELIDMQREYGNAIRLDYKYDSILTCCNNTILAGFIYYRCMSCENDGIEVEYNIHIEQAECCFGLHEIIEILGILIDNACENIKMENTLEKRIKLELQEVPDKITITVSNPAKYISFSNIDKMFVRGYSTKGENRGIGLARVLELINKYEADIRVFNSSFANEENWIYFVIEIKK